MTPNIHQQISWLEQNIKAMRTMIPKAVSEGRLSEEHGTHRLACAHAALQTLTQLRGIVHGKEVANV